LYLQSYSLHLFQTAQVPYPFTSKEQYEAHMALPLGRDFNAGLAFVDLQKPEVVVRRGSYVKPIEFVAPDEKKTRQEKKRKLRPKNLV
jgi:U3 small nucleolar RNA-associated protein 14